MKGMKAAVLRSPGDLAIEDVKEPERPKGGALIRVDACAICPTDIKMARRGQRDLAYPRVLGHEVVGTVVDIDGGEAAVGDRVQVWPGICCGTCRSCLKGQDNMCSSQGIIGFNYDGGFAQYMAVPPGNLRQGGVNVLSKDVPSELASLAEPLACCVHGRDMARTGEGDMVLIFGAGPMGLMSTAVAKAAGGVPIVVEPSAERRAAAEAMGAARTLDPGEDDISAALRDLGGADVAVLASAQADIGDGLLRLMTPRGRVCVFSGLPKDASSRTLDLNQLHYRELSLVGAYGCTSTSNREAVRLISSGAVDLRPLISRTLPLEELEYGFRLIESRKALKCVVTKF
ncbi:alcohol dehydrogenase catalytic domain-containing protein [Methanomassiliicoccus luminyensis]|uniref:alcohol dehydrogenase catalytic domain-containing protein n=2 Tax=Methanomassiliicoccus luminyensis TaxID=1080712 RepID=UPI00037429F6|nr:alcohol dehydrogenase catalytic domain-containing protein [Methanomassiliicoccus luminyensis]